jgi:hypothetical protein
MLTNKNLIHLCPARVQINEIRWQLYNIDHNVEDKYNNHGLLSSEIQE